MTTSNKYYPAWVCNSCGLLASNGRSFDCSTFHYDYCGACGWWSLVTEPRDFFYPEFKNITEAPKKKGGPDADPD